MQPINKAKPPGRELEDLVLVPDALDNAACELLIDRLEREGFLDMSRAYPPGYRNNDRCVLDTPELAAELFGRLRPHLPEYVEDRWGRRWTLVGLNSRFRACRYRNGQAFVLHRDGAWSPSPGLRTFRTLMVYLNDQAGFTGGGTRFYQGRETYPEVARRLSPATGSVAVFGHDLWHDGEAVTAGTKYVLRTDLVYRLTVPDAHGAPGHLGYVWDAALLDDGRLVTGSRDGTVGLWSVGETLVLDRRLPGPGGSISAIAALGENRFASGGRDGMLHLWVPDGEGFRRAGVEQAHIGAVLRLERAGDGLLTSGADGSIARWAFTPDGPSLCARRSGGTGDAWLWAMASDGGGGAWLVEDGRLLRLDSQLRERDAVDLPHGVQARSLAASPGGALVLGGEAGAVYSRAADTTEWTRLGRHQGAVRTVAILANGRIASGGEDARVLLWDGHGLVGGWQHEDFVSALVGLPSMRLVSVSYDGGALLGDGAMERPPLMSMTEGVSTVAGEATMALSAALPWGPRARHRQCRGCSIDDSGRVLT